MTKILFLPGSGASPDFWKPVGTRLPQAWPKEYFGWPGLGDQPHDPAIRGMDDLVGLVEQIGPVAPDHLQTVFINSTTNFALPGTGPAGKTEGKDPKVTATCSAGNHRSSRRIAPNASTEKARPEPVKTRERNVCRRGV
jgi:hypothetical protein